MRVIAGSVGNSLESRTVEGSYDADPDTIFGVRNRSVMVLYVARDDTPQSLDPPACELTYHDALTATGVPQIGDIVNLDDPVVGISAREHSPEKGVWKVTVYTDTSAPIPRPDNMPVQWWWDGETVEKVIQRDPVTNLPIVNSVGEPLLLTAPVSIQVLTIERLEYMLGPNEISNRQQQFANKTNSHLFWNFPVGTVLCHHIAESPAYNTTDLFGHIEVRRIRYVFKMDVLSLDANGSKLGWAVELLNHGTKFKVPQGTIMPDSRIIPGAGQFLPFLDSNKTPTTGNLNLDGTPRDVSLDGTPISPAPTPIWLKFNRFGREDFNTVPGGLGPYVIP